MAYCRVKEENKATTGVISKEKTEINVNKTYFYSFFEDLGLDIDSLFSSSKDDDNDQNHWEDIALDFQKKTRLS